MLWRLKLYALGAAGFVLVVLGAYFHGAQKAKARIEKKQLRQRVKNLKISKEIRDEIDALDDDDLAVRARSLLKRPDK